MSSLAPLLTLTIDTSTEWGSLALGTDRELWQLLEFSGPMRHSTTLFKAMERMHLENQQIKRIIVGLGPGSFSGIRVALAAAQGIALAKGATLLGLPSVWSVGRQFRTIERLGVFADARRGEYYCTTFLNGEPEQATTLIPSDQLASEIRKFTLCVSAEELPGIKKRAFPRAVDFLTLPADSPLFVRTHNLEPIYLREATNPGIPTEA